MEFGGFWEEIKPMFFDQHFMFSRVDGRVIIAKNDGSAMTQEELEAAAVQTGAKDWLHYDKAMDEYVDQADWRRFYYDYENLVRYRRPFPINARFDLDSVKPDIGRKPEKSDEALLSVPYFMRDVFGSDQIDIPSVAYMNVGDKSLDIKIVGIHYYFNREKQGAFYMTKEGVESLSNMLIAVGSGETSLDGMNLQDLMSGNGMAALQKLLSQSGGKSAADYRQASLFYSSNSEAKSQLAKLKNMGFLAAMSTDSRGGSAPSHHRRARAPSSRRLRRRIACGLRNRGRR